MTGEERTVQYVYFEGEILNFESCVHILTMLNNINYDRFTENESAFRFETLNCERGSVSRKREMRGREQKLQEIE